MTNLTSEASWADVRQIDEGEYATGGPNGNMNEQATALLARTEWLNQQKASKSEIVQGHYEFGTYAEFNTAKTSLPVNCTVTINEIPTGTQTWGQGTNRWNGTTLSKSPYDPVEQAKADATTKANAAEANAKSYVDEKVAEFPVLEVLSSEDIYNKAKENPFEIFSVIWQEYNKPIYHIGNGTFVDVTGVTVVPYVVIPELVFTIKLTEANQTFVYPTRANTIEGQQAEIDWGDGSTTQHDNYNISHTYAGNIGDEFQVKVKGNPLHFDFGVGNGTRRVSRLMLKSIDKNTMPKTMTFFDLVGCTNLTYLCRGAYSSWINTAAFAPKYAEHSPNLVFHPKVFEGLESVTNISNLFYSSSKTTNFDIPSGLLDTFVNATIANNLFRNLSKPLPTGILDKLVNLENVSSMFYGATVTTIDSRIFKNQAKLTNVSQCFRQATSLVADAFQLYTDMNQGRPTTVNGCFVNVPLMTNLAAAPAEWKTL